MLKGATARPHNPFERSLPTMLCGILRPLFPPPPKPDCYPTRTSPQIATVLPNRRCGQPVFSDRAPASADWPSDGAIFKILCVEFCWTGRRKERCRTCNMVKESRRGKFPLNTAVSCVCVSSWVCVCVVHTLLFMRVCGCVCVCYTVTKCGWASTACVRCV